jgi:hypothetical protein
MPAMPNLAPGARRPYIDGERTRTDFMFRFLLAVMATIGLGVLFALAETVRRPLARLVRAVLLGLVTVLTITGLAIGVTGLANETWWAAIVGAGIMVVAARLGWALRRRRARAAEPEHVPLTRALPDPHWRSFDAQLDWVGRQQMRRSRQAIEGFLAERDSPSLSHEHRALLLSCEKRVPELIETCLDRCRNASSRERDRYIDETLARLNQIGAEAERARVEIRSADDQRLSTLHRYFDDVAGERGEPRRP